MRELALVLSYASSEDDMTLVISNPDLVVPDNTINAELVNNTYSFVS